MKKYLWLLCMLAGPNARAQYRAVDSILQAYFQSDQFSGVALIADHGKIKYENAVGYRRFDNRIPLETGDVFELASVSKQFTAMVIMMLKERGKLGYDDPIEKYVALPYKGITIRHLLTHTSGLPDYMATMEAHWDKTKIAGNDDILSCLNQYQPPVLFAPGTKYNYSNTGYVVLASIAEKAAGRDFVEFCTNEIFRKLKMKHTAIRTPQERAMVNNFASGHLFVKERNAFIAADSFPAFNYTIWLGNRKGPGRVSSTAEDLLRWDRSLYAHTLVTEQTLEEAFTPMKLGDGTFSNYGFGWVIIPNNPKMGKIVWHNGDNPGYKTLIMRFIDKKKTLVLLCNDASDKFEAVLKNIQQVILNTK